VLLETMRSLGVAEITVCTAALREGLVVDRFLQTGHLVTRLREHIDPRSESVHALLEKYQASRKHAEQVARLAQEIFLQTRDSLHSYGQEAGHLLWSAAMLHDVGTFIGRNGHHKHSYYLIKNGGLLGHSEEEVELIANIARYHRGSFPKESHDAYNALRPSARLLVSDMAAILRLAEALDRSHRQVVRSMEAKLRRPGKDRSRKGELVLTIYRRDDQLSSQPEEWALKSKKALFEKQFAVNLSVTVKSGQQKPQPLKTKSTPA